MTPQQLNSAASALSQSNGGVASQDGINGMESNSSGSGAESPNRSASGQGHMTNVRGRVHSSSSEGESEGGDELTRAEALAMLRRKKGKIDVSQRQTTSSTDKKLPASECQGSVRTHSVKLTLFFLCI